MKFSLTFEFYFSIQHLPLNVTYTRKYKKISLLKTKIFTLEGISVVQGPLTFSGEAFSISQNSDFLF